MRFIVRAERSKYTEEEAKKLAAVFGFRFYGSAYGDQKVQYLNDTPQAFPNDERTYLEVGTIEDLLKLVKDWGPFEIDEEGLKILNGNDY